MPDSQPPPLGDARATRPPRRWLPTLLRVGVALGAFAYLATLVDAGELAAAFARVPARAWLELAAWVLLGLSIGAFRWGLLMVAFGAQRRLSQLRLMQLYLVGQFYNTFLLGVGGDVVRGVASREAFGDRSATAGVSVVLVERAFGLAGLLVLTAGVTLLQPLPGVPAPHLLGGAGLLAVLVALAGLLSARRLAPHLPGPLGRLAAAVPTPQRFGPLVLALPLSVLGHLVVAIGGHALIAPLASHVTLPQSLVLIPIALASAFVPITIAGAGVREAAFVALYGLIDVPESASLAASLGIAFSLLVLAGVGGLITLVAPLSPAGTGDATDHAPPAR